jgi:hypothetical protein
MVLIPSLQNPVSCAIVTPYASANLRATSLSSDLSSMKTLFLIFLACTIHFAYAQPPARHLERIAFDSGRGTMIMYGGGAVIDNKFIQDTSVYEWDAKAWREFKAVGPGPRLAPGFVYDAELRCTLLFGGTFEGASGSRVMDDVWKWDGARWTKLTSTCPLKDPEGVYDPDLRRILVYGELASAVDGDARHFELWELKRGAWKKLSDSGPELEDPAPVAYDTRRKQLIISLARDSVMSIWEWAGTNNKWTTTTLTNAPSARRRHTFAYHPKLKATILHGGLTASRSSLDDMWSWDGKQWKKFPPTGLQPRSAARSVFGKDALIEYGGVYDKGRLSNEIWLFDGVRWILQPVP